jgi:hypothetical protein
VAGALFVLIVGVGILWLIRFRSRGGAHGPSERESTRAGLRIAGWVVIVFGVVAGAVTWAALADLGFWPLVVPGSIVAVGLAFVGVTRWIV